MSKDYKCLTRSGYSNCNLGKFFGIKMIRPNEPWEMSFETTSEIQLYTPGSFILQFQVFYNCSVTVTSIQ